MDRTSQVKRRVLMCNDLSSSDGSAKELSFSASFSCQDISIIIQCVHLPSGDWSGWGGISELDWISRSSIYSKEEIVNLSNNRRCSVKNFYSELLLRNTHVDDFNDKIYSPLKNVHRITYRDRKPGRRKRRESLRKYRRLVRRQRQQSGASFFFKAVLISLVVRK